MLYVEGKFSLTDHNLHDTDNMSMAHGVEVRVPLLDQDLVALAAPVSGWHETAGAYRHVGIQEGDGTVSLWKKWEEPAPACIKPGGRDF